MSANKGFARKERVAADIRRRAADIILNEVSDPRVKFATVTEADVSADLKNARIYVSFLSDDEHAIKDAMAALEKAKGFIRTSLARSLKLRYMPEIHFVFDALLSESMKLDELIAKGLNQD